MTARLYVEGGGDSKELHSRLREGVTTLLERSGLTGRLPRVVAGGSRNSAFADFITAHRTSGASFVALLVDSEDVVSDPREPWAHLKKRDGWDRPPGATDDQALLMTTSMETWLMADRAALSAQFGACLNETGLFPIAGIESRTRQSVLQGIERATRDCGKDKGYSKGRRSFELLARLNPAVLMDLPSFHRAMTVLQSRL